MVYRSLTQLQPEIIMSQVTQVLQVEFTKRGLIDSPSNITQAQSNSPIRIDGAGMLGTSACLESTWLQWRLCSSLIGRSWSMTIRQSLQGWNFSLLTYHYVSADSLVAGYTWDNNIEGLRVLFSNKKASPLTVVYANGVTISEPLTLLEVGSVYSYPKTFLMQIRSEHAMGTMSSANSSSMKVQILHFPDMDLTCIGHILA